MGSENMKLRSGSEVARFIFDDDGVFVGERLVKMCSVEKPFKVIDGYGNIDHWKLCLQSCHNKFVLRYKTQEWASANYHNAIAMLKGEL